jgi:hypothetical protein
MRKLIVVLALATAAMALGAQAASAEIPDPPIVIEPPQCGIPCITGPDPDDLPTPIEEPDIEDPAGPGEVPEPTDAVCTSRVTVDGATVLGQLQTLIQCPAQPPFNAAKLKLLRGTGVPKCDRRDDIIRLHFLRAPGGTSLRPTSGECLRDTDADGDRDVLYSVDLI